MPTPDAIDGTEKSAFPFKKKAPVTPVAPVKKPVVAPKKAIKKAIKRSPTQQVSASIFQRMYGKGNQ